MKDGKPDMKIGDMVCYREQAYRVGICMTNTSIELVELNAPSRGLWVGRNEVSPVQPTPSATKKEDNDLVPL